MNRNAHDVPRLLIMIDNLGMGGAQKLLEVQVAEMTRTHALRIVNLGPETDFARSLAGYGVEVVSKGGVQLKDVAALVRMRRELADWAPDLIHTHLLYATLIGSLMARTLGVPHVTTLHNERSDSARVSDLTRSWLERMVLRHLTEVVIACGPRIAEIQKTRTGKTLLITVANRVRPLTALPPMQRLALRQAARIAPEDVFVLAAGRLMPQKGFDILVSAFAEVIKAAPKALLFIVGDGPDRLALEQQAKELGLGDRLRFPGPVADLGQMLQIADAFVLSSRHEGLPLVLIEALSAGLPIVSTRVGDVETLLDDSCGLLVDQGEAKPLATALVRLVGDADLRARMGKAASLASRKHTDVAGFVNELKTVYARARQRHDG